MGTGCVTTQDLDLARCGRRLVILMMTMLRGLLRMRRWGGCSSRPHPHHRPQQQAAHNQPDHQQTFNHQEASIDASHTTFLNPTRPTSLYLNEHIVNHLVIAAYCRKYCCAISCNLSNILLK